MKIAFIAYDWPDYRGGPIVNARRLLPELHKRGHEVHALIFFQKGGSPTADYLRDQGVNVHIQHWLAYTEQHINWILKTLIRIKPDVFVPNLSVAGWYAARWAREAGIPTIAALRSGDAYHWDMIDEFVCGRQKWAVSGLVCVSQLLYEQVQTRKPLYTKLHMIPSGVPLPEHVADQNNYGLRIAYVGRFVQESKRIFDLIDALSSVLHLLPESRVTLFGHAPNQVLQEEIDKKILSTGLSHRIQCAGSISPEELQSELITYHVLVLLSDYEGTPGSVMDGMACGLVPVCLDIPGGVQELVINNKTGLLVKDRKDSFFKAMQRLDGDIKLREILSINARVHIEKNYSLTIAADRWEKFCAELLQDIVQKKAIKYPKRFDLPPIRMALAREDKRKTSILYRIIKKIIKRFQKIMRVKDSKGQDL